MVVAVRMRGCHVAAGQQLGLPYEAEVLNRRYQNPREVSKYYTCSGVLPHKSSFSEGGGGEVAGSELGFSNMSPGDFKAPS